MGLRDEIEQRKREEAARAQSRDAQQADDAEFTQFLREFVELATELKIPAVPIPAFGKYDSIRGTKRYKSSLLGWGFDCHWVGIDGNLYTPRTNSSRFGDKEPTRIRNTNWYDDDGSLRDQMISFLRHAEG